MRYLYGDQENGIPLSADTWREWLRRHFTDPDFKKEFEGHKFRRYNIRQVKMIFEKLGTP